jgi:alkanesulfonate monooxygenase SsuD/methylene tetrahydromethanopterin reductase-like flavin-dependent oxidoreductase (luciferase family)
VVFTAQTELQAAREFFADVKGRTAKYGRTPDDIKIMPGITPVIGRTLAEAQEKYDELQSLLPDDVALAALARFTRGVDIFAEPRLNFHCDITGGVLADECAAMISGFFESRRQQKKEAVQ